MRHSSSKLQLLGLKLSIGALNRLIIGSSASYNIYIIFGMLSLVLGCSMYFCRVSWPYFDSFHFVSVLCVKIVGCYHRGGNTFFPPVAGMG